MISRRQIIWRSAGPIFTIFTLNESFLAVDDRPGPLFSISQGTLPWQPILCKNGAKLPTPLHLSLCHSETEWAIVLRMIALIALLIELCSAWSSNCIQTVFITNERKIRRNESLPLWWCFQCSPPENCNVVCSVKHTAISVMIIRSSFKHSVQTIWLCSFLVVTYRDEGNVLCYL